MAVFYSTPVTLWRPTIIFNFIDSFAPSFYFSCYPQLLTFMCARVCACFYAISISSPNHAYKPLAYINALYHDLIVSFKITKLTTKCALYRNVTWVLLCRVTNRKKNKFLFFLFSRFLLLFLSFNFYPEYTHIYSHMLTLWRCRLFWFFSSVLVRACVRARVFICVMPQILWFIYLQWWYARSNNVFEI